MKKIRKNPISKGVALAIIAAAILVMAMLWPRPAEPPSMSLVFLDYTNRVGPYALIAITNLSAGAITLDKTCVVKCSLEGAVEPRRASFDASQLRVTQLRPNEGFVQEIFVFPARDSEWQFECYAAYSSKSLEATRSAQGWLRRHFHSTKLRLTAPSCTFNTKWFPCPIQEMIYTRDSDKRSNHAL